MKTIMDKMYKCFDPYSITAGIGPMSDEELSVVMDNSRYLTGVAVSGYNGADVDLDGTSQNMNMAKSNTLPFINIDNQAGNMRGEVYCIASFDTLFCTAFGKPLSCKLCFLVCVLTVSGTMKKQKITIQVMSMISYDSKHNKINLKSTVF